MTRPSAKHRLDAEHLVAGRAVAQHVHTAGVGRDRSADGRGVARRRGRRRSPSPRRERGLAGARSSRRLARSSARRACRRDRARRAGAGRARSRRVAAPSRRRVRCCRPGARRAAPASLQVRSTADTSSTVAGRTTAGVDPENRPGPVADLTGDDVGIGEHVRVADRGSQRTEQRPRRGHPSERTAVPRSGSCPPSRERCAASCSSRPRRSSTRTSTAVSCSCSSTARTARSGSS